MLVNVLRLLERCFRSVDAVRATVGSRVAGLTLDGGESGGNRESIC